MGGSRSGPCTCVSGAAEGGAMPLNRERRMEAEAALGRGAARHAGSFRCTGRWGWGARPRPPLWLLRFSAAPALTATSDYCPKVTLSAAQELNTSDLTCQRRQWQPTPVLLPGKSHGWRSLVGCSPWGWEESNTTEQLPFPFSLSCIGEGHGNPLQCSCLENPRDGGAWWAAVYGVAQSQTRLK